MKVLYVMGMGRSGSTVLDILIGGHPDAVGTGELTNLVSMGWSGDDRCACGLDARACRFWSVVRDEWLLDPGYDPSTEYVRLQETVEYSGRRPWIGRRPSPGDPAGDKYAALTTALLRSIERVSGKDLIVDSSKNPVRALALSRIPGIDLFVVHLVRDARAVAWSFAKDFERDPAAGIQSDKPGVPTLRSAIRWNLINAQAEWVRKQMPRSRSIQVRYEDLTNDPKRTMERIGAIVGLDVSKLAKSVAAGTSIPVRHPVAGNRLRMGGSVQLRPDETWRREMSRKVQTQVHLLTWPLMLRYGYR